MNKFHLFILASFCFATVYSFPLKGEEDFAPPSRSAGVPRPTPASSFINGKLQIHDASLQKGVQQIPASNIGTQLQDASKRLSLEDNQLIDDFDEESDDVNDFNSEESNELEEDYVQPAKQSVANSSPSKTTFKTSALNKTAIRVYKCPPNVPSYCPNAKVSELGPKGKNCEDAVCTINLVHE